MQFGSRDTAWSFACDWNRCKFKFCEDLKPKEGIDLTEAALEPFLETMHQVMDGHVGFVNVTARQTELTMIADAPTHKCRKRRQNSATRKSASPQGHILF